MYFSTIAVGVLLSVARVSAIDLETDISKISRSWGQVSVYADNDEDYFGVEYVGLPDGCQIESASTLQRHAQRFPTSGNDDGGNDARFAQKLSNFTSGNSTASFTGPLAFLNKYQYVMQDSGLLTGIGASTEFAAGVTFWNRYGRTLYNATQAQLAYNASYPNGTARAPVVLRTTSQSRIENSQINWALGFFGTSFQTVPDPTLANFTSPFEVVIIPEGGTENNTLASYDSCFNDDDAVIGYLGDDDLFTYLPKYLGAATARLQKYAPSGFTFNYNDTYAMQSICAYEYNYIGMSDFCYLFTADEWAGFENTLDMELYSLTAADYYDYSYGNPTGRAQGIGYVQELIARLTHTYITTSDSSVNSTIDNNPTTFPLHQPFYADFSHDDIIVSVLTAMSVDYFRDPPSLTQYPPNPNRHFILSHMTPFGGRLITETIGCSSPDPYPVKTHHTAYTPTQYGYDPANATYKFVRMRLNNGIVPLNTIRGGYCGNATSGRVDGMCAMEAFLESQESAYMLSNYDYACFGNYSIANATSGMDYDGTISA
ncbi:putative phytase [Mollisia scopiformis]|uniref:Putative phytase n=1 Tax=Mollisia scopiformis TaxID=149040 RepID=A0A194XVS8_MOLSC|nr:putative phytase [Mollisia scopiformis]KUJ23822.1 putative phytase [Mollisia scopiformis]